MRHLLDKLALIKCQRLFEVLDILKNYEPNVNHNDETVINKSLND